MFSVCAQIRTVPMKRLIRNKTTKEFFQFGGTWTQDAQFARNFDDIRSVVKAEQEYRLQNVELVLLMGDKPSKYDVILPLGTPAPKRTKH